MRDDIDAVRLVLGERTDSGERGSVAEAKGERNQRGDDENALRHSSFPPLVHCPQFGCARRSFRDALRRVCIIGMRWTLIAGVEQP